MTDSESPGTIPSQYCRHRAPKLCDRDGPRPSSPHVLSRLQLAFTRRNAICGSARAAADGMQLRVPVSGNNSQYDLENSIQLMAGGKRTIFRCRSAIM